MGGNVKEKLVIGAGVLALLGLLFKAVRLLLAGVVMARQKAARGGARRA